MQPSSLGCDSRRRPPDRDPEERKPRPESVSGGHPNAPPLPSVDPDCLTCGARVLTVFPSPPRGENGERWWRLQGSPSLLGPLMRRATLRDRSILSSTHEPDRYGGGVGRRRSHDRVAVRGDPTRAFACRNGADASPWAPQRHRTRRPRTHRSVGGGLLVRRRHRRRPIQIVSIVDEHIRECLGGLAEAQHHRTTPDRRIRTPRRRPRFSSRAAALRTTTSSSPAPRWPNGPANPSACTSSHPVSPSASVHRIVQRPGARRMPQHQHVLVSGSSPHRPVTDSH